MAYKGPHVNQAWFVHISLDPKKLRQGNIHWTAIDNVPGRKFKFISEFIPFNSFRLLSMVFWAFPLPPGRPFDCLQYCLININSPLSDCFYFTLSFNLTASLAAQEKKAREMSKNETKRNRFSFYLWSANVAGFMLAQLAMNLIKLRSHFVNSSQIH